MILSDVWYVCSIPWGLRGGDIDTIPACSQLLCCRWFLPQHNIVLSAHMFQCVDLNEKARTNRGKPGLALFWRLANTWVRTAGRSNSLDRTTQSRTEAHDRYNKGELISLAMPPLLFPNEDNGGSNVPKQRVRTFGVLLNFCGHWTENVENTDTVARVLSLTFWNNHCENIGNLSKPKICSESISTVE